MTFALTTLSRFPLRLPAPHIRMPVAYEEETPEDTLGEDETLPTERSRRVTSPNRLPK